MTKPNFLPIATLTFFSLILPVAGQSGAPEFEWAVRAGGAKHDKTRGLTCDAAGNVFMTGEFAETADFGKQALTSRGNLDFFLAKYSPTGECLWVRQGGGTKVDRGYEVEVDREGNAYVTGHYESDDATFGEGPALPQRGQYDIFVAKYDPSGKLLWLRSAGGAGYDYGHGIGVDGRGNCYVTGGVVGNNTFGEQPVENPIGSHLFLAKYDRTGEFAWVRQSRGKGAAGQTVAVDRGGNSWVAGNVAGDADFGGASVTASGGDVVLVKYDPEGKALWAAGAGGSSNGVACGVGVDAKGNSYINGMFKANATFGSTTLKGSGEYDVFAAGYDPKGVPLWAHMGSSPGIDYGLGLAADPRGGCYAVGEIGGTAGFEGVTVPNAGGRDLFIARYEADGKLSWIKAAGAEKDDLCYCVALDGKGRAYLSGAFNGATKYGATAISAVGGNDVFLTRVRLP